MIQKIIVMTFFLVLFLITTINIQAQKNTCRLTYALMDKKTGTLSSTNGLGTLSFNAEDEGTKKTFVDSDSGIKIWVEAQIYGSSLKKTPKQIDVAIFFGELKSETEDLFHYADSAIAETIYDKNFKFISVSKTIETKDEIYRFRFNCSKDK